MKLSLPQLEPHLHQSLSTVYLVSGDELLLKQDAIQLIRKAAKQAGFSERTRLTPEDGEQLYALLYSRSLLAEKRVLELAFRDSLPNKIASTILQEYAKHPSPDNLLLIDMGKVDDKIAKSAWYRALEKTGIVITIWPIPREQLPQWIRERAKRYRLSFQQETAQLLADYVEGNLVAASQAIEKIYLLKPQSTVTTEMVQSILTDESRFTIFDLTDSLIAGNKTRLLHILYSLKMDGTEPILILWGLARELRLMASMLQAIKQGQTTETLFQKHRIFSRRQASVNRFLARKKDEDCWQALLQIADMDSMMKGGAPGDMWDRLQLFCLGMA